MKTPYRFLLMDDDEDAVFFTRRSLEKAFPGCVVIVASSCEDALDHLRRETFDALLADHHLHGTSGGECIAKMRALGVQFPILLVTNSDDPAVHDQARAAGATAVFSPEQRDFVPYLKAQLQAA